MKSNPLVYSTKSGRINQVEPQTVRLKGDGIVRIQRQVNGRKGKGVCIVSGLDLDDSHLASLATELKKKCACGGAIKDGCIEIQGNNRELLQKVLEQKGYIVKLSGG